LFIAPGLYSHEKKYAIPFVVSTSLLFATGVAFAHFIAFPWVWLFFAGFGTDYMDFMPKIAPVFALYAKMLLAFGVVFQLPILVLFLARLGVVTPGFLLRNFKYAVLIMFVLSAILTPPDVVSQIILAGPMVLLYLLGIGIAWIFRRRTPDETDASS
jgi:sec-independent protein translocase protein TatC